MKAAILVQSLFALVIASALLAGHHSTSDLAAAAMLLQIPLVLGAARARFGPGTSAIRLTLASAWIGMVGFVWFEHHSVGATVFVGLASSIPFAFALLGAKRRFA